MSEESPSISSSEGSTTSLVGRLQAEDERAWQRLIDLYSPLVYSWCRQAGLAAQDAADVMQEVFLAVSKSVKRYQHRAGTATFRGWLWTITRNKTLDHFRKGAKQVAAQGGTDAQLMINQLPLELSDISSTADGSSLSTNLFFQALDAVKKEFRPQTWRAFWLVVVEGYTTAEVGEQMGISANGVRQAKSRVLRRLREELGDVPG